MKRIEINSEYELGIEPEKDGVRFTLFKSGDPYVCRKANRREARAILDADNQAFFSGRLKLHKRDSQVVIRAKEERVGTIPFESVREELEKIF